MTCLLGAEQVGYAPGEISTAIAKMQKLGLQVVRFPLNWGAMSPDAHTVYWSGPDEILKAAAGIKVIFTIFGSPKWASGSDNNFYVPTGWWKFRAWRDSYAQFFASVVARYGTRVMGYEVWNEPNTNYAGGFWNENGSTIDAPHPHIYARLFNRVKAANPAVKVGIGGVTAMTQWDGAGAITGVEYLRYLIPLITKPDFVGIHPYTSGSPTPDPLVDNFPTGNSFAADIVRTQTMMLANGWGNVPIWITEFGDYPDSPDKARYIKDAFDAVTKNTAQPPVEACIYFQLSGMQP